MAEQYYTILTNVGKAALANAQATGGTVNFSEFAVGDGLNGSYYNPSEDQEALKNEVWRGSINSVDDDSENPGYLNVEGVIPDQDGGFYIREIGLFDDSGNMIAIAKAPETYKPTLPEGSTTGLAIKMVLAISNSDNVELKIDPSSVIAMQSWVINNFLSKADATANYAAINGNKVQAFKAKEDLTSEDNVLPLKTLQKSNDQNLIKNGDFSLPKANDKNSPLCWVKYGNGNIIFDEVQQAIKVIRGVSGQTVIYQVLPKELKGKKISVSFKYKMNTAIGTYANIVLDDGTAIGPSASLQPSEEWTEWSHTFTLLNSDTLRLLLYCPEGTNAVENDEILIKDVCLVTGEISKPYCKHQLDLLSENVNIGPFMTQYLNENLVYTVNSNMTSAEIQAVINSIPKYIPTNKTVNLIFSNGTYNLMSSIHIRGFYGGGVLNITTETVNPELNKSQNVILECNELSGIFDFINITNNKIIIFLLGIKFIMNNTNGSVIRVANSSYLEIAYCYIKNANKTNLNSCILAEHSKIYANMNYYDNAYYGVKSMFLAHIIVREGGVDANGLQYGLYASFGGLISKAAATITGSIANEFFNNGGQIW